MSGVFGSKTVSTTDARVSSFQVTESSYGAPLSIVFGTTRISGKMLDYDDFTAIAHTTTTSSGGKGGGVTSSQTSWTYTVAVAIALGEGKCTTVGKVWASKNVGDLETNQMTFFDGEVGQNPWGYNVSNHPEKAIGYSGIAYVAGVLDLGTSTGLPNFNFELYGLCQDRQGKSKSYVSSSSATLQAVSCSEDANAEIWTIGVGDISQTFTNSGYTVSEIAAMLFSGEIPFSVVGSISGVSNNAVIGEYYNNGKIQFTIPQGALSAGQLPFTIAISSISSVANSTILTQQYAYQKTIDISHWSSNISVQEYVYGQGWVTLDSRFYTVAQKQDSLGNYIAGVYTYTFNFDDRTDGCDRADPLNIRINYNATAGSVQYTPVDANPRDIIYQLMTNQVFGAQFPIAYIDDWSDYSAYCIANSLLLSEAITSQRQTSDIITSILEATNSDTVWSQGKSKIVPYYDGLTPIYDISDDNILGQDDNSIVITRNSQADSYNVVPLEYLDRANDYNTDTVYATDQGDIDLHGIRQMGTAQHNHITVKSVAQAVAQTILQKQLYIRNQYVIKLGQEFILLEAMDPNTLACAMLGLDPTAVRVVSIKESKEDYSLEFTFEDNPTGVSSAPIYEIQEATRNSVDYATDPGNINPPIIFEPPDALSSGFDVCMGASGINTENWGGCYVWISEDENTFKRIGEIASPARQGILSSALAIGSDPDTVNTLSVDLTMSAGKLSSGTQSDADNYNTICYADGELISYEIATLTGANQYDLTYLRRGVYGTTIATHNANTQFMRIDKDVFFSYPFTQADIGKTIYFKFTSYNIFGAGEQSLADVEAYQYTITGSALNSPLPDVENVKIVYQNNNAVLQWDPVVDFRTLVIYEIRKGSSLNAAQVLGRITETSFALPGNDTYWIAAAYQNVFNGATSYIYSLDWTEIIVNTASISTNIIATNDESATGWRGSVTGGAMIDDSGDLILSGADDFDSIINLDLEGSIDWFGGVASAGIYTVPADHIITLTSAQIATISIAYQAEVIPALVYFDTIAGIDNLADWDGNNPLYGNVVPQINVADDLGVYAGWQNFTPGQYYGRYFNTRLVLTSTNTQYTVVVNNFAVTVNVQDRTESGNISVTAGGMSVLYGTPFHMIPSPQITILNAHDGDLINLTAQTSSGFTVQITNGGSGVLRSINYASPGY